MNRLVTTLISLYISAFLFLEIPFVKNVTFAGNNPKGLFISHALVFVIFFILLEVALGRHIYASEGSGIARSLRLALIGLANLGLLIVILYHMLPVTGVYTFPSMLNSIFASDIALTLWLLAPLVLLCF